MSQSVWHLKVGYYIHVQDENAMTNLLVVGPTTFVRKEHQKVASAPRPYVVVPPGHYVVVENPVLREGGKIVFDKEGQAKVRIGDQEVRMNCEPFPLYPGEQLAEKFKAPQPLQILEPNTANRVRALRDLVDVLPDGTEVERKAGDEWLVEGPGTYIPHVAKEVVQLVRANFIHERQALRLRAVNSFTDRKGAQRKVGDEWLWTELGAFIPSVDEEVVKVVQAKVLTDQKAIHVLCNSSFKDCFGQERKPGDEWLVTNQDTEAYLPTPNEEVTKEVPLTVLNKRQYCVLLDPYDSKKKMNLIGTRRLIRGPTQFFLHPGESLLDGTAKSVYVLQQDEALLLEAIEQFVDEDKSQRAPGDSWLKRGPVEYIPPVQVKVKTRRRALAMHENEGVYIRDMTTGAVRAQSGPGSYMLKPEEELWEKELSAEVEGLLSQGGKKARDKRKLVVYSVPHNSVCQVFDYKKKTSRFVVGPDLVKLQPDEEFTVVVLSGDKPKVAGRIKTLAVILGPDFMTDNIKVETADHARLELQLSYNWRFDIDPTKPEDVKRVFSVPDFVGDSCKAIASRIRGSCAGETFDNFHQNSSTIIRHAVFGSRDSLMVKGQPLAVGAKVVVGGKEGTVSELQGHKAVVTIGGKPSTHAGRELEFVSSDGTREKVVEGKVPKDEFRFPANNLVISNVDIQSVEPVDQKTKDSLMKSVQLAIHITTQSQEAAAKHKATEEEQRASGELKQQLIRDNALSEKERMKLLQLQAESQAIESTGAQRASAHAAAEASRVESESLVELARKKAQAQKIQMDMELQLENQKNEEQLSHQDAIDQLEVTKAEEMAKIETEKFRRTVKAIGQDTIKAMARAGPENQVRLLKALNLQGYMVTDGSSPINLFNAAQGMTGQMGQISVS